MSAKIFAKGEAKGKAEGLKLLLTRRFGRVPRWAIERVDTAAMTQLDAWLVGIFDAQSLEDLLGPKPNKTARAREAQGERLKAKG